MENNTKREPLRLVDGKFMRGGFVVAPVIGDREQIALLQAAERAAEERERRAKRGELKVDVEIEDIRYKARLTLTCVCGYKFETTETMYADDIDEMEDVEWNDTVRCPRCRRQYDIDGRKAKLISE